MSNSSVKALSQKTQWYYLHWSLELHRASPRRPGSLTLELTYSLYQDVWRIFPLFSYILYFKHIINICPSVDIFQIVLIISPKDLEKWVFRKFYIYIYMYFYDYITYKNTLYMYFYDCFSSTAAWLFFRNNDSPYISILCSSHLSSLLICFSSQNSSFCVAKLMVSTLSSESLSRISTINWVLSCSCHHSYCGVIRFLKTLLRIH